MWDALTERPQVLIVRKTEMAFSHSHPVRYASDKIGISSMSEGVGAAMKSYNVFMPRRSSSEVEPLLIDRAAAAELPSADAVREWASEKRAFISSVMAELTAERQAVAAGIRAVGLRPVMFEEFGGRDADPEDAYLAEIEDSDIYIGIIGKRYGKPLKSRFSPTHAEYRHAEQPALRMAVWTLQTSEREGTGAILPGRSADVLCRTMVQLG